MSDPCRDYISRRTGVAQLGQRSRRVGRPQPGQRIASGSSASTRRVRTGLTGGGVTGGGVTGGGVGAGGGGLRTTAGMGNPSTFGGGRVMASSRRTARATTESPIGSPHWRHRSAPFSTSAPQLGHFIQR
jgi:hypothetical protein